MIATIQKLRKYCYMHAATYLRRTIESLRGPLNDVSNWNWNIFFNMLLEHNFMVFQKLRTEEGMYFRLRSHCSVFKFIYFCVYPAPVYTVPCLYKNRAKNSSLCAFTLLTRTEKNLSVFVAYNRSHGHVFVKLHKGSEAVTLIWPVKLIAANSVNRKTSKTYYIPSHRFSLSSNSTLNLASNE